MSFVIRTDVPLPKSKKGPPAKYPFSGMGVGHSFYVPRPADAAVGLKTALNRLQRACSGANKRLAPARFVSRIDGDGVGVWRVE